MNDRVNLKESIGRAISYGISPGTADRIGAIAMASKLGILLWEWKYAGLSKGLESENLLTRRMAKRLKIRHVGLGEEYKTLRLACRQTLLEWYAPECESCKGVKELQGEHKRVVCDRCQGLGLRRYGDIERAKALRVSAGQYKEVWDRRCREIRDMIVRHDAETGMIVREQLKPE